MAAAGHREVPQNRPDKIVACCGTVAFQKVSGTAQARFLPGFLSPYRGKLNRRWTQINADNQRVALIVSFTLRVKLQFFRSFLKSMSICVHLRFISLSRFT
jgi:hypothetical protein